MPSDSSMLRVDFILPCQVDQGAAYRSGEQALLLAVIEDAIFDLRTCAGATDPAERELYDLARAWFESPTVGTVTLADACGHLGFDVDAVRTAVLRLFPARLGRKCGAVDTVAPICGARAF